jgi:glyoxylate reductase
MRVLVHSRTRPGAADLAPVGAEWCETVEDLLPRCDVVTLHCPATAATRGLLDAGRLRLMRPGAILVNTARGGLVDEEALAACLRDGPLAGAGLDVYAAEPAVGSTLRSCENAVLLPHLGSATRQARAAMGHRAIDNLTAFFAGEAPPDRIA